LLKSARTRVPEAVEYIHAAFAAQGIDPARVAFATWRDRRSDHLAAYADVDIALDTFPYHGTTTTCEALWMGLPVVTRAGGTHVSRVGASLLAYAGLPELVAADDDAFIGAASALARDGPRRTALRADCARGSPPRRSRTRRRLPARSKRRTAPPGSRGAPRKPARGREAGEGLVYNQGLAHFPRMFHPDYPVDTRTMPYQTDDLRIREIKELAPPSHVLREYPINETVAKVVFESRSAIHRILHGADDRLLVIMGPCSIHDVKAAKEYAKRLKETREALKDNLEVVMRVYFEKPRTTVGWKGLINDPQLDGSFRINEGLRVARELLLELNASGVPAGCEFLDMITPQYIADLVAWGAIGARTTESQIHRELASGLSCPVGFKNGTDGSIRIAVDAVRAAQAPHHFLSVTKAGHSAIVSTAGNEDCHIILRGGKAPNYDAASVDAAGKGLAEAGLAQRLMIDFSHSNSSKKAENQVPVGENVAGQIKGGDDRIFGVMVESHLKAGRQDLVPDKPLVYGQSITDGCIGWDESRKLLETLAKAVRERRLKRATD